jgi:hypothetical protein
MHTQAGEPGVGLAPDDVGARGVDDDVEAEVVFQFEVRPVIERVSSAERDRILGGTDTEAYRI